MYFVLVLFCDFIYFYLLLFLKLLYFKTFFTWRGRCWTVVTLNLRKRLDFPQNSWKIFFNIIVVNTYLYSIRLWAFLSWRKWENNWFTTWNTLKKEAHLVMVTHLIFCFIWLIKAWLHLQNYKQLSEECIFVPKPKSSWDQCNLNATRVGVAI